MGDDPGVNLDGDSPRLTCSGYVPIMGGKDLNRQPRLSSLRHTPAGWIRLAACNSCSQPLPVDQLIRKHGELALVEVVLVGLRCTECHGYGASVLMVKLSEPGCPRQR